MRPDFGSNASCHASLECPEDDGDSLLFVALDSIERCLAADLAKRDEEVDEVGGEYEEEGVAEDVYGDEEEDARGVEEGSFTTTLSKANPPLLLLPFKPLPLSVRLASSLSRTERRPLLLFGVPRRPTDPTVRGAVPGLRAIS